MNTIHEHTFNDGYALSSDDREIIDIYAQLFRHHDLEDDTRIGYMEEFTEYNGQCYVLRTPDGVAGVANYKKEYDNDTRKHRESYLQGIAIDKKRRRLGYGALMMGFLLDKTFEDGNNALILHAWGDDALKFYSAIGFEVTDTLDPDMPAMRKYVRDTPMR